MASLEILEYLCEDDSGCSSRATRAIKSKGGNMVKKVCVRHAGPALKAQAAIERGGESHGHDAPPRALKVSGT
jgi:hypothetical protein